MTNKQLNIPLVDFEKCGLLVPEDGLTERNLVDCGNELYAALSTVGFAYLTNHGIQWRKVDEMNEISAKFYSLPLEEKKKFEGRGFVLAYDSIGRTQVTPGKIDYSEGFRTGGEAYTDKNIKWPDVPGLKECYSKFVDITSKLLMRVLKSLGHGMKLKVRDMADNLVDVHPIPESIVVNVGDILETWSGKELKATKHRVVAPSDPSNRIHGRRSIVYFGQANQNTLMKKLKFEGDSDQDESDTDKKPMTVDEYMHEILSSVYLGTL